jgi:hypothetical protein
MHYDASFWDWKTKQYYRWKDLPKNNLPSTWEHYCTKEQVLLRVEKTFMCPHCLEKENKS